MKSHHTESKKYFLKLLLSHESLEETIKNLLGHSPRYPLHLTLSTVHLAISRPELFDLLEKTVASWNPTLPKTLDIERPEFEVMGMIHIKFLSLCFECSNFNAMDLLGQFCDYLSKETGLKSHIIDVNGRMEMEFYDADNGEGLIHIPLEEKKIHVSLLSTNDFPKKNKSFSKDSASLLKLIDLTVVGESLFHIESKSFS